MDRNCVDKVKPAPPLTNDVILYIITVCGLFQDVFVVDSIEQW